jgi:hypothetical protein
MNVSGSGKVVIGGVVVGFILGGFIGGLIAGQYFYGFTSVILGVICAGLGGWLGYKIGQSNI